MDNVATHEGVGQVVARAIEGVDGSPDFRRLLRLPLEQPEKALAGCGEPRWPALVYACARAAGGDEAAAIQVAAAVEIFIAAGDVFDELEDGDISPLVTEAGHAQALNAASALLMLSQDLIATLDQSGVPIERIPAMQHALLRSGLTAAAGQHADLAAEGCTGTTTADALEIARSKAGALAAGAAHLGAALGTTDASLLALYEAFGRHYGTMAQLANDLHDAYDGTTKSDHQRAKQTLPRIFTRAGAMGDAAGSTAATAEEIEASGALHFTWVVIELERQRAREILAQLAARGQAVAPLEELVS